MSLVPFVVSIVCTTLFVMGTWFVIKALGTSKGVNPVQSAFFVVIGLALKFPAALYVLKVLLSRNVADRNGAIAAVILVYFSTVLLMTFKSLKENKIDS